MKSVGIVFIILFCIFFFWIPLAIGASVFGILAGFFALLVGLIGGLIGIVVGIIGGFFSLIAKLFTLPFHWEFASGKTFLILAIILVVILAARSRQNTSA